MPRRLKKESLHRRSPSQLADSMRARGMRANASEIRRYAKEAMRQTRSARNPDSATQLRDLARIEAAMKRAMIRELKDYERREDLKQRGLRGKGSLDQEAIWQAIGANNCPSCIERHGEVKTMRQWNALGVPGSGNLLCDGDCNCDLIPLAWVEGEE